MPSRERKRYTAIFSNPSPNELIEAERDLNCWISQAHKLEEVRFKEMRSESGPLDLSVEKFLGEAQRCRLNDTRNRLNVDTLSSLQRLSKAGTDCRYFGFVM
jgi:hypothetical protein